MASSAALRTAVPAAAVPDKCGSIVAPLADTPLQRVQAVSDEGSGLPHVRQ
ncbi:hypothetical protein PAMC26510_34045 [Caballeronia sordidicola]|uniref:Uncharacterized protein n=1 Tax=Caballeronia sordidicola TaxID=196367 RepID=A0A242M7Q0_CABSO|nr:hypothetical protein PAMC26510_34045 [Caballeronia sordidicola]